jgi:hypothetical protein
VNVAKRRSYPGEELLSRGGRRHAARGARQQANTDPLFQTPNGVTQGRWRDAEAFRGPREASLIVPIPGTTKLTRLEENLGAADLELTADDLREIDAAASRIEVQGARYSEAAQRLVDR